jgi:hypothetical protein
MMKWVASAPLYAHNLSGGLEEGQRGKLAFPFSNEIMIELGVYRIQ